MICPSCGLHNELSAERCVGCHHHLPLSPEEPALDPNPTNKPAENLTGEEKPTSSPVKIPEAEDSPETRSDKVPVPDLKQKEFETKVKDFLDRDFVKMEGPSSSSTQQTPDNQKSTPTKPTLTETNSTSGKYPSTRRVVKPKQIREAVKASAASTPQSQGTLFADKIQRIEIELNQSPLPFGKSNTRNTLSRDPLHQDLQPATVWDRFGAGIIDTLLVMSSWLIFSLVTITFTDFKVLSISAGLTLGLVFEAIALSYFFLFTVLHTRTPGMGYMGLTIVRFDGEIPSLRDVALRIFGYCISMGCFGLGFLWACFDSERLTWHDRISKTVVIEFIDPTDN